MSGSKSSKAKNRAQLARLSALRAPPNETAQSALKGHGAAESSASPIVEAPRHIRLAEEQAPAVVEVKEASIERDTNELVDSLGIHEGISEAVDAAPVEVHAPTPAVAASSSTDSPKEAEPVKGGVEPARGQKGTSLKPSTAKVPEDLARYVRLFAANHEIFQHEVVERAVLRWLESPHVHASMEKLDPQTPLGDLNISMSPAVARGLNIQRINLGVTKTVAVRSALALWRDENPLTLNR